MRERAKKSHPKVTGGWIQGRQPVVHLPWRGCLQKMDPAHLVLIAILTASNILK